MAHPGAMGDEQCDGGAHSRERADGTREAGAGVMVRHGDERYDEGCRAQGQYSLHARGGLTGADGARLAGHGKISNNDRQHANDDAGDLGGRNDGD